MQRRSAFLLQSLHRCERDLDDLHTLETFPLPLSLLFPSPSLSNTAATASPSNETTPDGTGVMSTHLPQHFVDTHPSEMHELGHYLDVSDDDVFSSKHEWLTTAAYASSSSSSSL